MVPLSVVHQNLQPISTHERRHRISGRASNRANGRVSKRYLAIFGDTWQKLARVVLRLNTSSEMGKVT